MSSPFEAVQDLPNACRLLPAIITGGQPSAANLAAFKAAGGEVVLDLRDPMEPRTLDEAAVARSLGLEYVNVPVGAGSLTDETLDRILDVLHRSRGRQMLIHCASGNRVGGALLPFLVNEEGLDEEDAVGQAMRVGLRSAELMEWGLEYARRHRGS